MNAFSDLEVHAGPKESDEDKKRKGVCIKYPLSSGCTNKKKHGYCDYSHHPQMYFIHPEYQNFDHSEIWKRVENQAWVLRYSHIYSVENGEHPLFKKVCSVATNSMFKTAIDNYNVNIERIAICKEVHSACYQWVKDAEKCMNDFLSWQIKEIKNCFSCFKLEVTDTLLSDTEFSINEVVGDISNLGVKSDSEGVNPLEGLRRSLSTLRQRRYQVDEEIKKLEYNPDAAIREEHYLREPTDIFQIFYRYTEEFLPPVPVQEVVLDVDSALRAVRKNLTLEDLTSKHDELLKIHNELLVLQAPLIYGKFHDPKVLHGIFDSMNLFGELISFLRACGKLEGGRHNKVKQLSTNKLAPFVRNFLQGRLTTDLFNDKQFQLVADETVTGIGSKSSGIATSIDTGTGIGSKSSGIATSIDTGTGIGSKSSGIATSIDTGTGIGSKSSGIATSADNSILLAYVEMCVNIIDAERTRIDAEDPLPYRCCNRDKGKYPLFVCNQCVSSNLIAKQMCEICFWSHKRHRNTRHHDQFSFFCPHCLMYCSTITRCTSSLCDDTIYCGECIEQKHEEDMSSDYHKFTRDHSFPSCLLPFPKSKVPSVPDNLSAYLRPGEMSDAISKKLNVVRAKSMLADFVQPVLVEVLRMNWIVNGNKCSLREKGHSDSHDFNEITIKCVVDLLNQGTEPNSSPTFQCTDIAPFSTMRDTAEVLCRCYDVGALAGLLLCWMRVYPAQKGYKHFLDAPVLHRLKVFRNWVDHTISFLADDRYNTIMTETPAYVTQMIESITRRFCDYLPPFDIEKREAHCTRTIVGIELDDLYRAQLVKDAHQLSTAHIVEYIHRDLPPKVMAMSSKVVAEISSDNLKFLIIPKFNDSLFKDTQQLQHIRNKLRFLTQVEWASILDLNEESIFDEAIREEFTLKIVLTPHVLVYGMAHAESDVYGFKDTLYTHSIGDFHRLRRKTDDVLVVLGVGPVDYGSQNTEDLRGFIKSIRGHTKDAIPVLPLTESPDFIRHTKLLDVTIMDETEAILSVICSVDHVAAFLLSSRSSPKVIHLPAGDSSGESTCGFLVADLQPFVKCLDILHSKCDDLPLYTPQTTQQHDGVDSEACVKVELRQFLRFNRVSWFLLKHNYLRTLGLPLVVKRNLLDRIEQAISFDHKSGIVIYHESATGATTLARHLLYVLRNSKVCVVVEESIRGESSIDSFISVMTNIHEKTRLRVVVLLDQFGGAEDMYDSLLQRKCRFLVLILATTDKKYTVGYQQASQEKVFPLILLKDECKDFQALLGKIHEPREVHVYERNIANFLQPSTNMLDLHKIMEETPLWETIRRTNYSQLTDWGFLPEEILSLNGNRHIEALNFENGLIPTDAYRDYFSRNKDIADVDFLGFMSFIPSYHDIIKSRISKVVSTLNALSKDVLKICVFSALFAPAVAVSRQLVSYILRNDILNDDAHVIFSSELNRLVVSKGHGQYEYVCVRTIHYAYILAPMLFGPLNQGGYNDLHDYVSAQLIRRLKGYRDRPLESFRLYEKIITNAFCESPIWHGSERPNNLKSILKYPFLIEMFFCTKEFDETMRIWNELLAVVKELSEFLEYGSDEYKSFQDTRAVYACTAARLVCDEAFRWGTSERQATFEGSIRRLSEASDMLADFEDSYNVCDRKGNIKKTELRLLFHFFRERDLPWCIDDSTQAITDAAYNILRIAEDADKQFKTAINCSYWAKPHPIVGDAQSWETLLSIIAWKFCKSNPLTLAACLEDPTCISGHSQTFFRDLSKLKVVSYCFVNLKYAAYSLKQQREKGRNAQYLVNYIGSEKTKQAVKRLLHLFSNYKKGYNARIKSVSSLDIALADNLMTFADLNDDQQSKGITCEQAVYCILAYSYAMFRCSDSEGVDDFLEGFFRASTLLVAFHSVEVEDAFKNFEPLVTKDGVSNIDALWDPLRLNRSLHWWASVEHNNRRHRETVAQYVTIAYYLCRVIFESEDTLIQTLVGLLDNLNDPNRRKSSMGFSWLKFYLGKSARRAGLLFSALYAPKDLPFMKLMKNARKETQEASIKASEQIYVDKAGDYLYKFHGKCQTRSTRKIQHISETQVTCEELGGLKVLCNNWTMFDCEEGDDVTFFIVFRATGSSRGLFAHGIEKVGLDEEEKR